MAMLCIAACTLVLCHSCFRGVRDQTQPCMYTHTSSALCCIRSNFEQQSTGKSAARTFVCPVYPWWVLRWDLLNECSRLLISLLYVPRKWCHSFWHRACWRQEEEQEGLERWYKKSNSLACCCTEMQMKNNQKKKTKENEKTKKKSKTKNKKKRRRGR